MKAQIVIVFLVLLLAACTPSQPIPVDAQNTALTIVQTGIALTQTALPTVTPPLPTFMPTATVVYPTPSPLPTQPPFTPIMTPDVIQVERWKEYEDALAQGILPMFEYMVLCEWDILGRSGQEVYVWATCRTPGGDDSRPAVIHLGTDGAIQQVEVLKRDSSSNVDDLFPKEVQEKFSLYALGATFDGRRKEMYQHLIYRETHPDIPPLVVLSSYIPASPTTP